MFSSKESCGLKGKETLSWDEQGRSHSFSSLAVSEIVIGILSLAHHRARAPASDAPALVIVMDNGLLLHQREGFLHIGPCSLCGLCLLLCRPRSGEEQSYRNRGRLCCLVTGLISPLTPLRPVFTCLPPCLLLLVTENRLAGPVLLWSGKPSHSSVQSIKAGLSFP